MTTARTLSIITLLCLAVVAFFLVAPLVGRFPAPPSEKVAQAKVAAAGEQTRHSSSQAGVTPAGRTSSEPEPSKLLSERSEAHSDDGPVQDDPVLQSLRTAIEASVYERLDPGAILDAALQLSRLDADKSAIPEPDPTGHLLFPIQGTPPGVIATLEVAKSNKSTVASILSLNIELPSSSLPFEGAVRDAPSASIKVWADNDGKLLDVTIMTSLTTNFQQTRAIGVDASTGTFRHGVLYHIDAQGQEKLTVHGMKDGKYISWEVANLVDTARWPRMDELNTLSKTLLEMYDDIVQRNRQR